MREDNMSRQKHYDTWNSMRNRCHNPNNPNWKNYGGRGIKVCDRWLDPVKVTKKGKGSLPTQGFLNFLEDMESTWFPGATIDRINNDGDYTPENCQWLSKSQNTKKEMRELIQKGTHNFLNGKLSRERVSNGTHNFLDGGSQRERALKRVENGTHNFLGPESNRKRMANGTHNFITNNPSISNHPALGTMWITNGSTSRRILKNSQIPEGWKKGRTL